MAIRLGHNLARRFRNCRLPKCLGYIDRGQLEQGGNCHQHVEQGYSLCCGPSWTYEYQEQRFCGSHQLRKGQQRSFRLDPHLKQTVTRSQSWQGIHCRMRRPQSSQWSKSSQRLRRSCRSSSLLLLFELGESLKWGSNVPESLLDHHKFELLEDFCVSFQPK